MQKAILLLFTIISLTAQAKPKLPHKPFTASSFQESLVVEGYMGAGVGIPYGIVGMNAEVSLNPNSQNNLYATGGVGILFTQGLAYSGGLNFYLLDYDRFWRPRLSMLYGTNGFYHSLSEDHVYQGLNAGIGQLFQFGIDRNVAISLDAILVVSSGLFDKLEELGEETEAYTVFGTPRVKFSLGIKWAF